MQDKDKNIETNEENKQQIPKEPDSVTREINLDELYDGALNNTTIIDPLTKDEVLFEDKKHNYTFIGIVLSISVLLLLYFVSNKTDIGGANKEVKPVVTTPVITTEAETINGVLNCTSTSSSDSETRNVIYKAYVKNNLLTNSTFNFSIVTKGEVNSVEFEELKKQYETFYINNSNVTGNITTFDINDNGFTFNVETDYATADFENITILEKETLLYGKPSSNDTYQSLNELYTSKGLTCNFVKDEVGEQE